MTMTVSASGEPRPPWTARSRLVVFVLAASSIACLLADFYGLCPMRSFTVSSFVFVTISAHAVFGMGLGLSVRWLALQRRTRI